MIITTSPSIQSSPEHLFQTINGSYKISNNIVSSKLKVNGEATLKDNTIVKDIIIVNGQLKAFNTIFESDVFANGVATLEYCSLKGNASFSGNISTNNCLFLNGLTLLAQKAHFSKCSINSIFVKKITYAKVVQTVILANGSTVSGDITFESGIGEVYIDSSSEIKGALNGGKKIISS